MQLQDLKFEKFNPKDETLQSTAIPFEQFVNTVHNYKGNSPIPYSGKQILEGVGEIINKFMPDQNRSWGNIYVYKSQYEAPNYVKKLTGSEPEHIKLLTPQTPVSDIFFPRFIGTIDIVGNNEYTERIAIKCDDNKSIQMAFGLNVRVCDNFTIFSKQIIQTNTREKREYNWILGQVENYMKIVQKKFDYDLNTIVKLQEKTISESRLNELVGGLLMRYETKEEVIPVTMLTDFSRKLRTKTIENAWDFINAGTETIRFDSNSGDSIIETMANFVDYTLVEENVEYTSFI
jgi:hypothetical protein